VNKRNRGLISMHIRRLAGCLLATLLLTALSLAFAEADIGALIGLYAGVAVPMLGGLIHGRAPFIRYLLWPLAAALAAAVLGLLQGFLRATLTTTTLSAAGLSIADDALLLAIPITGYLLGRLAARTTPTETRQRGTRIVDGRRLQRAARKLKRRQPHTLTLAGIPIAPLDETKHFKLIGTTGSGKSTALREVLRTALLRGDRALIADPDSGYLSRFYDPNRGDRILNPFDPRSARWDPFAELRSPYDADQLARALIPDTADSAGREWRAYARTFLAALLRRALPESGSSHASDRSAPTPHGSNSSDLGELWRRIAVATTDDLRPLVRNTPAQPFLEPANARMFGSIRSVTTSALAGLEHVAAQHAAPLSIRSWVGCAPHRPGTETDRAYGDPATPRLRSSNVPPAGVLFMPYQAGQIATLRSLIATGCDSRSSKP
jgi:hypothetical protein